MLLNACRFFGAVSIYYTDSPLPMFIHGTVNPVGEEPGHTGVYLTTQDIDDILESKSLYNKPILIEHKGDAVGKIISAWKHADKLDCLMEIDNTLIGKFAQHFVEAGKTPELSLGYIVEVEHSAEGKIQGRRKKVVEVSLVKKGARENCLIHGFSKLK